MTEDAIAAKITEHDIHLDKLSVAIEHLAATAADTNAQIGKTNDKIDRMVEVLSAQNVIKERLNNLEDNLKESFKRVHGRADSMTKDVDKINAIIESVPTPATIRWGIGILIAYTMASASYVVTHIHTLETQQTAYNKTSDIHKNNFTARLNRLENNGAK